jgi:DNA repair protein RecN (Recombination protein N)
VLLELRIENLLLIERAELRLGEGLNVITGETGAGKTILAHSLDLIMGGKARPQIVRPGADEAYVEGTFALPEGFLDDPELSDLAERVPEGAEELVLGRRVGASGRTTAFVQRRSASAADLNLLGARLLAFYGQHEHRRLTLASAQAETLDGFAGAKHLENKRLFLAEHSRVGPLGRELEAIRQRKGARDAGEEEDLAAEREKLRHAEGLRSASAAALAAVAGSGEDDAGAAGALAAAEAALAAVQGLDARLDGLGERARALSVELSDLSGELRGYGEGIDAEPGRLEEVEERLDALDRLKRKHGGSIDSVLAHAERCRSEIERMENAEEVSAELDGELAEATKRREALAAKLSEVRAKAARRLEREVAKELDSLAMNSAQLKVKLEPHPDGFGPGGAEIVEFEIATNPGLPVSPLRDAASGGELSRVMLALTRLGRRGGSGTLVFDEVDAGIGGNAARAVGERLRVLGEERQLVCITHLPQVASLATTHFRIEKGIAGGQTTASVERVDGEELVAEITRMLGADRGDEAASRHARELLEAA